MPVQDLLVFLPSTQLAVFISSRFLSFLPVVVLIPVSIIKAVIPFGMPSDCLLKLGKIRSTDFPLSLTKKKRNLTKRKYQLHCHDLLLINHILYFIQISICCYAFNYSFLQVVFKSVVYFCAQIYLLIAVWIYFLLYFLPIKKHYICWLLARWYHSHPPIWACCSLLSSFHLVYNSFHTLVYLHRQPCCCSQLFKLSHFHHA